MTFIERAQSTFPLTPSEITRLVQTASRRYKEHTIEKRNGRGLRLIAQPSAEIKSLQRWAVGEYLSKLPIHDAAMAYRKGKSIRQHAEIHAHNKYLLKLDFANFFPSIRAKDFGIHAKKFLEISEDDIELLKLLLFRFDKPSGSLRLAIGAPSSPYLSNTIVFEFDKAISDFCFGHGVLYSRYADDLAFSTSTPKLLDEVKNRVAILLRQIEYPRLVINEEKTVFVSKKFRRQLTGLVLTNEGRISIGHENKRAIRAAAHHYKIGELPKDQEAKLRGMLAYCVSVDPEFVKAVRRMLGEEIFLKLVRP